MDLNKYIKHKKLKEQVSPRSQTGFKIERLHHLVLTVADINKTMDFYTRVLGMEVSTVQGPKALNFGQSRITVHEYGREFLPKAKRPTPGSADLCFLTKTKLEQVIEHVESCNVTIIEGPVSTPGALGRMTSVYFNDPDNNLIEVCNYP